MPWGMGIVMGYVVYTHGLCAGSYWKYIFSAKQQPYLSWAAGSNMIDFPKQVGHSLSTGKCQKIFSNT